MPNPTQALDYRRFTSDNMLELFVAERDVLHRLSPGVPVTTNFMTLNHFRHLDYFVVGAGAGRRQHRPLRGGRPSPTPRRSWRSAAT